MEGGTGGDNNVELKVTPLAPHEALQIGAKEVMKRVTTKMEDQMSLGEIAEINRESGLRLLVSAYKESLVEPESGLGAIAETYQKAKEAREHLDEPAEANKLLVGLEALYKQGNLEGGEYKKVLEVPPDTPPEDYQKLIKAKLGHDFDRVADDLAQEYIKPLAAERAGFYIEEDKTRTVLEKEGFSRSQIMDAINRLQAKRADFLDRLDESSDEIGGQALAKEVRDSYKRQWEYQETKLDKQLGDLDESERQGVTDEALHKYKDHLFFHKKDNKTLDRLAALSPDESRIAFTPVADIDRQIQSKRTNLVDAMNVDPEVAFRLSAELRDLQFEKDGRIAELKLTLAEKRVQKSGNKLTNALRDLGTKLRPRTISLEPDSVKDKKTGELVKEVVGAWAEKTSRILEKAVQEEVAPIVQSLAVAKEGTAEVATMAAEAVRGVTDSTARSVSDGVRRGKEGIRGVIQKGKARGEENLAANKIAEIETRKQVLNARWEAERFRQGAIASAIASEKQLRVQFTNWLADRLGGEVPPEMQGKTPEEVRKYLLEKSWEGYREKTEELRGKAKDNPLLAMFDRELVKSFDVIRPAIEPTSAEAEQPETETGEPPESVVAPAVPAETGPDQSPQPESKKPPEVEKKNVFELTGPAKAKFEKEHPGIKTFKVVEVTPKAGEKAGKKVRLMVWDDQEGNIHTEQIDDKLSRVGEESTYKETETRPTTLEEAEKLLVDNATTGGAEVKSGLSIGERVNGEIVFVEKSDVTPASPPRRTTETKAAKPTEVLITKII